MNSNMDSNMGSNMDSSQFPPANQSPLMREVHIGPAVPHMPGPPKPTAFDSMAAAAKHALNFSPGVSTYRHYQLQNAMAGELVGSWELASLAITGQPLYEDSRTNEIEQKFSDEDQQKMIDAAGLTGRLKTDRLHTKESLQIKIDYLNESDYNEAILKASNHGALDLGAALAASFLDPATLGLLFMPVPGIGMAKTATMLGKATQAAGWFGRSAVYAGKGALQGAFASAMIEPYIFTTQAEMEADYTLANSLCNIGFGTVMGAALHPAAGHFGEWRRAKTGRAQVWEYVPESEESRLYRDRFTQGFKDVYQNAVPDADMARMGPAIDELGVLYDRQVREIAYLTQTKIGDVWESRKVEFLNGEAVSHMDSQLHGAELAEAIESQRARIGQLERDVQRAKLNLVNFGEAFDRNERALKLGRDRLAYLEERRPEWLKKLMSEARDWKAKIDAAQADGAPFKSRVRMFGQTPLIIELLGANDPIAAAANSKGIVASRHFFDTHHPNITTEMRKQTPEALAEPLAIFDAVDEKGQLRRDAAGKPTGEVVFMLDIKDRNGATTILPVALKKEGDSVTLGIVKSFYAKDVKDAGTGKLLPRDNWFRKQLAHNARYVDMQKLERWNNQNAGANSPLRVHNAHGHSIINAADLVKAREDAALKGYTLYQRTQPKPEAAKGDAAPDGSLPDHSAHLPEAARGAAASAGSSSPAPVDQLYHSGPEGVIRGSTTFEGDRAIIRLFAGADIDTMAHESAHVLRRQYADFAGRSPELQKRYKAMEERFGVKDGAWTTEQEEAFANAWVDYLKKGEAPDQGLAAIFASMSERLLDIYGDADAAGLPINPQISKFFDSMLTVPMAEGRWQFNKALAEIATGKYHERLVNQEIETLAQSIGPTEAQARRILKADSAELDAMNKELLQDLDRILSDNESKLAPEASESLAKWTNEELAAVDADLARMPEAESFMKDFLSCIL